MTTSIPGKPVMERAGLRLPAWVRSSLLVLAVAVVVAGCGTTGGNGGTIANIQQVSGPSQTNSRYPGAIVVSDSVPKPNILLTDTAGQPYDLQTETRARVTLVYFGYTHCPDVCPINMALTASALELLPAKDQNQVTVLFISTDPARDTAPVIRAWLDKFNPAFVGLRGTITQIHEAEAQVGMPLSVVEGPQTGAYQIEHSGYVLGYAPDGTAHLEFDSSETPGDYATSLRHLIAYGYRT